MNGPSERRAAAIAKTEALIVEQQLASRAPEPSTTAGFGDADLGKGRPVALPGAYRMQDYFTFPRSVMPGGILEEDKL